MKRLHMKHIEGKNLRNFVIRSFLKCQIHLSKTPVWLWAETDYRVFKTLYFIKMDFIELPLMDVYEIRANSKDGICLGYAFDTNSKIVSYSNNFFLVCNSAFKDSRVKDLNSDNFDLKFKLSQIHFHEYAGMASLVTSGLSDSISERLELNH